MEAGGLRPGQVVVSLAGRDRGRAFIVLKVLDGRSVLVADGVLRKSARPKMKNVRHLSDRGGLDKKVARKLAAGMTVTDQDLREALRDFVAGETTGG